jgi:hypothetical protein
MKYLAIVFVPPSIGFAIGMLSGSLFLAILLALIFGKWSYEALVG